MLIVVMDAGKSIQAQDRQHQIKQTLLCESAFSRKNVKECFFELADDTGLGISCFHVNYSLSGHNWLCGYLPFYTFSESNSLFLFL